MKVPTYIKVAWHHDFDDEPVELFSEVVEGHEVRKVEVYRDGHADFADERSSSGSSVLSAALMPSLADVAKDPQFTPEYISPDRFEAVWRLAHMG